MDAPVSLIPGVGNGRHIAFFLREVPHGMILKIFDPFLADPGASLLLLFVVKQFIQNTEQFSVFLVNKVYPNIKPILPY